MIIVFDLDNTIVDEYGQQLRPGIINLLQRLINDNHQLFLWTNSTSQRAEMISNEFGLKRYFKKWICREDYDKENKDGLKDIRKVKGKILIDDNPIQKKEAEGLGYHVIIVKPFTSTRKVDEKEMDQVLSEIIMIEKWGMLFPIVKLLSK